MARTKSTTLPENYEVTDAQAPGLPAVKEEADVMAKAHIDVTESIKLAYTMLGRREMVANLSKLLTVADVLELKRFKEGKHYKDLVNPESPDGQEFSSWKDFCSVVVGESASSVDEKILNIKVFGEQAIESMNNVGLGVRQLRQLRKLPESQIEEARLLAQADDKEGLVDLIEEQAVEKSKLKEQINEAEAKAAEEKEVKEKQLLAKDEKINELDEKLQINERYKPTVEDAVSDLNTRILLAAGFAIDAIEQLGTIISEMLINEQLANSSDAQTTTASVMYAMSERVTIKVGEHMESVEANFDSVRNQAVPILDKWIAEHE